MANEIAKEITVADVQKKQANLANAWRKRASYYMEQSLNPDKRAVLDEVRQELLRCVRELEQL